jgi:hypothetical protein
VGRRKGGPLTPGGRSARLSLSAPRLAALCSAASCHAQDEVFWAYALGEEEGGEGERVGGKLWLVGRESPSVSTQAAQRETAASGGQACTCAPRPLLWCAFPASCVYLAAVYSPTPSGQEYYSCSTRS